MCVEHGRWIKGEPSLRPISYSHACMEEPSLNCRHRGSLVDPKTPTDTSTHLLQVYVSGSPTQCASVS